MKKIILVCACAMTLAATACSDWFDVSPKTEVESEDLFRSESGFKNALIGIYGRMTSQETYGRVLTFGYLERLVQRYDVGGASYDEVEAARMYDYENNSDAKSTQASIWREMYRTIANINSLLGYIETNGEEYITTEGYYNLIKGEALGLRAFHYFDLLRMWGPVYSQDPTARAVPYREVFSEAQVPPMPANELAREILDDLHEADSLLADDRMILSYNADDVFIGERQYRMNKFAVKALMARVYLWIGDREQAALYAGQVIDGCGLELAIDNTDDVSMKKETLFGLQMYNMTENLEAYWPTEVPYQGDQNYLMSEMNWSTVFDRMTVGQNDIRATVGKGFSTDGTYYLCRKYMGDEENDSDGYYENIPLIRLSEMYYIMAECVPLRESVSYLNDVRHARGISRANDYEPQSFTETARREALQSEYSKDFFAEGQYFYFLKRNNYDTFYRCPVARMIYYVFPIPDAEREYGVVDVEEDVEN